jgi:hypothetical protein
MLPMDRIDPVDPMDRIEPRDAMDHFALGMAPS